MDIQAAEAVVRSVAALGATERIESLDVGHSPDQKFLLFESGAPRHLLRFSHASQTDRRRAQFEVLQRLSRIGAKSPIPAAFGATPDGSACYTATIYFPGEDAEALLTAMSPEEQHALGVAAGIELRLLHQLTPPEGPTDWVARHPQLSQRDADAANAAAITVPGGDLAADYVATNTTALEGVSAHLMHNDFYPANLIVNGGHLTGIIDFEMQDWGDPIHDFHKMAWFATRVSIPFARGQLHGYWDGVEIPPSFWQRYNLHIAMSLPSMLAFIAHVDPDQFPDWSNRAQEIVDTHDFRTGGPPTWFA